MKIHSNNILGISTTFVSIVSMRQHHGMKLGKSDMYFTCLLKPTSSKITIQEEEIADAKWMPVEEFLALPYYKEGIYGQMLKVASKALTGETQGFEANEIPIVLIPGTNVLYHAKL
eukprot:TRINITY_DN1959_c0_g1_i1.p1 TRINITY_DN1959_c0_g1~~TRINITY_DN1959_c0_g1_i1.p1  ORF type:complete len:116 (-),score=25.05 TRINITY_DN1959_c0_g1_i1:9-356(-)